MLFVLYPKTKLPMFNIDVGFDDGTIYEGLYQLSTKFPSVDDFINDLERRVLGADINQGQEGWMDTLINDANKRSQWLQSVFDIALPLEGSGKRLDEFFAKSVHQQSLSLDLPRDLDVFTPAIRNALEMRSGVISAPVLKRQEDWVSKFNSNNRQDLLQGINTGFHLDAEGAMVENKGNLPSFSQILWHSRLGILLDVLKDLKIGADLDLFHEKLFEMGQEYATYDEFVRALEQKVLGEDMSLNMKDWQSALVNDPVKRMNWLQALFNMVVSTEAEDRRTDAVNKFDSLRKPVSVWPEAAKMARNPGVLRKGLPSRSSPWASNNLRINNGFWSLGPEKALGLVSRGIRGALDKSLTDEGFAAPEREQFVNLGLSFLPLSASELSYGGVGWSNGITAFFIKDRLNIASTAEVQQVRSQMGREWATFLTDKDEVVVKNSASWDALKYLFLSRAVFEKNYDRLSALNLLGRVIVIDSKDDTVEYFMGDNEGKKTSLKREVLSEFDNKWGEDLRWQMASRIVMTDVFKNEYRQSLVDGKSREERIIEAASAMGHKEFTPEQIAEELHEDLDIVMDVLVDSQAYSLRATHINYNGQRTTVLVAKPQEAPALSWDDMTRELSPNEMKQYQKAKDEYVQHRASVKLSEVYPGRRIGRNGEKDRTLIVNHQAKGISAPGGIDLNAANLNLQIKRDGKGVPLPIIQQDLENIKIDGLVPVIIAIKPMSAAPGMPEVQVSGVQ